MATRSGYSEVVNGRTLSDEPQISGPWPFSALQLNESVNEITVIIFANSENNFSAASRIVCERSTTADFAEVVETQFLDDGEYFHMAENQSAFFSFGPFVPGSSFYFRAWCVFAEPAPEAQP